MNIGSLQVNNPVVLGPMAGVTDWAFRTVCAELGANITVTEMVSSRALVYKDKKSAALLKKTPGRIRVMFYMADEKKTYAAPQEYWVSEKYDDTGLKRLLGEANVILK